MIIKSSFVGFELQMPLTQNKGRLYFFAEFGCSRCQDTTKRGIICHVLVPFGVNCLGIDFYCGNLFVIYSA